MSGLFTPVSAMRAFGAAAPADPLLLDLDFRTPTQQAFPTAAGSVLDGLTFSEVFLCDEPSGNLVGELAATTLAPTNSPLQDRAAVGFYDGATLYTKKAVEIPRNSNAWFAAAAGGTFDFTTESFCILVVFRSSGQLTGSKNLLNKQGAGNTGYIVRIESDGALKFYLGDGSYSTFTHSSGYDDGVWHAALLVCDRSANLAGVYTTDAVGSTLDITGLGSITATGKTFRIGGDGANGHGAQVAYLGFASGAQCDGLTTTAQAKLDAFWQLGAVNTTPAVTYTRASLDTTRAGYEPGFGERVAKWADDQVPTGWDDNFSHAGKMALSTWDSVTNDVTYSEEFDNAAWTKTNVTVTANQGEAPDGMQTADKLAATAAGGYVESASYAVSVNDDRVGSVYVRRAGTVDVTGELSLEEVGVGVETAIPFQASAEWQRIVVWDAAAASTGNQRLRIKLDDNGAEILVWGAQSEEGINTLTSYIPTTSAAATRANPTCELDNPGGNTYIDNVIGEIALTGLLPHVATNDLQTLNWFSSIDETAGQDDERVIAMTNGKLPSIGLRDNASAWAALFRNVGYVNLPATEYLLRLRWDDAGGLTDSLYSDAWQIPGGGGPRMYTGSDVQAGDNTVTWSSGNAATRIYIGGFTSTTKANALIPRVRIWDVPRDDVWPIDEDDPDKILDLDFTEPAQQAFPATATGVIPGRTATNIWLFDEPSGNAIDEVGGTAWEPVNSPTRDTPAVGFYDGTDMFSKPCVQFGPTSTPLLRAPSGEGATLDYDAGSFAMLIVYRAGRQIVGGEGFILPRKLGGSNGWAFLVDGVSQGRVSFRVKSGGANYDSGVNINYSSDGAWKCVLAVVNRTTDEVNVYCPGTTAPSAVSIAAAGSLSDTSTLVYMGRDATLRMPFQMAYMATFEGAEAEGLGQADVEAFWTHGKVNTTPAPTYTRAGVQYTEVGDEAGFGARVAPWGDDQVPTAYSAALSHANKLAASFWVARTNDVTHSQKLDDVAWTLGGTGTTVTDNDAEAPSGDLTADKLTAGASGGPWYAQSAAYTVSVNDDRVASVWVKRAGGSDVAGTLALYDVTGAADESTQAFTATAEWQRVSVYDANAASTSQAVRIYITNANDAIHVWGVQSEETAVLGPYIPTTSAAATLGVHSSALANAYSGGYVQHAAGEVKTTWVPGATYAQASYQRTWDFRPSSGVAEAKIHRQSFGDVMTTTIYDSGGTLRQTVNSVGARTPGTEYEDRVRWDSAGGVDGNAENADLVLDGTRNAAGSDLDWTTGSGDVTLWIASWATATDDHLAGLLARLKVYKAPQEE